VCINDDFSNNAAADFKITKALSMSYRTSPNLGKINMIGTMMCRTRNTAFSEARTNPGTSR